MHLFRYTVCIMVQSWNYNCIARGWYIVEASVVLLILSVLNDANAFLIYVECKHIWCTTDVFYMYCPHFLYGLHEFREVFSHFCSVVTLQVFIRSETVFREETRISSRTSTHLEAYKFNRYTIYVLQICGNVLLGTQHLVPGVWYQYQVPGVVPDT